MEGRRGCDLGLAGEHVVCSAEWALAGWETHVENVPRHSSFSNGRRKRSRGRRHSKPTRGHRRAVKDRENSDASVDNHRPNRQESWTILSQNLPEPATEDGTKQKEHHRMQSRNTVTGVPKYLGT